MTCPDPECYTGAQADHQRAHRERGPTCSPGTTTTTTTTSTTTTTDNNHNNHNSHTMNNIITNY